ncbi:MAG TPA: hypothetical protein VJH03_20640 [Blastocatellia bacterium]|nr:hypothetical protein [Blastocatellia bacterium]
MTIVFASRRRAEAEATANSATSCLDPSSNNLTDLISGRSKLISSPASVAITSERVVTGGLFASICAFRSSTVRIAPAPVRPALVITTRAPWSWRNTAARPPIVSSSVPLSTEKGMSASLDEGGADEL